MTASILVVDDVSSNVRLLKAKLEKEYYSVLTALSGKEALKIAKKLRPDIILLDVMMPEMDGFEVCEILKADFDTENIPIIFITALDDIESKIRGLNYGAEDFLTKPINDNALFARVKSLSRLKLFSDELNIRNKVTMGFSSNISSIRRCVSDLSDACIVIIDDDKLQAEQVSCYLKEEFNNIIICNSCAEEFCMGINFNVDLVIVSMQSKEYDGLKLYSVLRTKDYVKHTPILMLIDEDDSNYLMKGMEIGINDYLTTPVHQQELIARVHLQIKKKKYHDALYNTVMNNMEMAIVDPLTKCYNRFYFDMHIKQKILEVRKNNFHKLALIICDVDFFKKVNDTYGHLVGDEILKGVSRLMHDSIRASDLLARFGGEEFVILFPNSSFEESVLGCAHRILNLVANHKFIVDGVDLNITMSMGGTGLIESDDMNSFLARADKNLYEAKNSGRNQIVFSY